MILEGSEIRHRDDHIPFCHAAIAVEGAGWTSADTIPLMIASTIIGAWDRTQGIGSLSASVLARAGGSGKALSYQAFNTCYKDTGLWGVYFVSERHTVEVSCRQTFFEVFAYSYDSLLFIRLFIFCRNFVWLFAMNSDVYVWH